MRQLRTGLLATTVIAAGAAAAATMSTRPPSLPVVSGAIALNAAEKADVTGSCGCENPTKPGYGFGAKVEHYGPPGQGFTPHYDWRDAKDAGAGTPKGNPLPPHAYSPKVPFFP